MKHKLSVKSHIHPLAHATYYSLVALEAHSHYRYAAMALLGLMAVEKVHDVASDKLPPVYVWLRKHKKE